MRVDLRLALVPLADAQLAARTSTHAAAEFDPHRLWTAIETDPRWHDWQEGQMTPREWYEHLTRRLGVAIAFEEFCIAWNRVLDPRPILEDKLFAALGASHSLALLSNTDPLHAACLDDGYSFVRYFAARIYSCRVGVSKPSPIIYEMALDALGVAAGDALYIDDIPEFAEAAGKLGMDAIRFDDPRQLIQELARRGLRVS